MALIFSLELLVPAYAISSFTKRRWRRAMVLDLHDRLETARGRSRLRRLTARLDLAVCVSEYVSEQLHQSTPRRVIPRPVDPDEEDCEVRGEGPTRYGLIGRIDRQKRVLEAVQAFSHSQSDAILVVRGAPREPDGAYMEQVRSTIHSSGGKVRLDGFLEGHSVLSGIDYLLFYNPAEPSGRVAAEAQLRGIPVICSSVGGVREHIYPGSVRMFVDDVSLRAIIDSVEGPPSSEEKASVREWAVAYFDPYARADEYLSAILQSLTGRFDVV